MFKNQGLNNLNAYSDQRFALEQLKVYLDFLYLHPINLKVQENRIKNLQINLEHSDGNIDVTSKFYYLPILEQLHFLTGTIFNNKYIMSQLCRKAKNLGGTMKTNSAIT